jgi:Sap, sulfolipid-1-addressing protein
LGPAIGDVLPLAAAIALFPIPALAVILMLLSPRAKGNVPGFLLGWTAGLAVTVTAAAVLTSAVEKLADDLATEDIGWIRIAIGAALLIFALKKWLRRPDASVESEMPRWMSAINDFSPVKALGVGLALTVLNPKNIALGVGAGTAVGGLGLNTVEAIVVGVLFIACASLGVAIPVLYSLVGGDRAKSNLDAARSSLVANNALVMAVLMIVIGVVLIGEGLRLF